MNKVVASAVAAIVVVIVVVVSDACRGLKRRPSGGGDTLYTFQVVGLTMRSLPRRLGSAHPSDTSSFSNSRSPDYCFRWIVAKCE